MEIDKNLILKIFNKYFLYGNKNSILNLSVKKKQFTTFQSNNFCQTS